jgi:polyisoprenyl-phosphate glycosyltransferase
MRISVVAPCFNEQEVLAHFCARATKACEAVSADYEIILVDDGSRDATWELMKQLSRANPRIVGLRLSRNHGHQLALTAGLGQVTGDRVLIIDADLQDPPELLTEMMRLMDDGADVVYGQRRSRRGVARWKRAAYKSYYKILSRLAGCEIPPDTGDFRLITRHVADLLQRMPEHHRFIRGMVSWLGFKQRALLYDRDARFAGQSQYTIGKLLRLALDGITSFSIKPLRIASVLAFGFGTLAIAGLLLILVGWWLQRPVQGWASIVVTILFLGSVQLFVLGIMGEYLGRLFIESKGRPLYLVAEKTAEAPLMLPDAEENGSALPSRIVTSERSPVS